MKQVTNSFWGKSGGLTGSAYSQLKKAYSQHGSRHKRLMNIRGWAEKPSCPYCGSTTPKARITVQTIKTRLPTQWRCGATDCHKFFRLMTNTHLHNLRFKTNQILALCFLVANHERPTRRRAKQLTGMTSHETIDRLLRALKPLVDANIKKAAAGAVTSNYGPRQAAELLLQKALMLK